MDPQEQDPTTSFELPPAPTPERPRQPQPEQQGLTNTEAQSSVALEQGVSQSAPPPPPAQQSNEPPAAGGNPLMNQPDPAAATPTGGWMPQIADDNDLIEKEWIIKAKEIVAQTAHDPHLQNKEMTKFKAEYLKKRYNKELRLSED
jgi:hypothetical protein